MKLSDIHTLVHAFFYKVSCSGSLSLLFEYRYIKSKEETDLNATVYLGYLGNLCLRYFRSLSGREKHRVFLDLLSTAHLTHRRLREVLSLPPRGEPLLHKLQRGFGEKFGLSSLPISSLLAKG